MARLKKIIIVFSVPTTEGNSTLRLGEGGTVVVVASGVRVNGSAWKETRQGGE